jgi:hypothetical protein
MSEQGAVCAGSSHLPILWVTAEKLGSRTGAAPALLPALSEVERISHSTDFAREPN